MYDHLTLASILSMLYGRAVAASKFMLGISLEIRMTEQNMILKAKKACSMIVVPILKLSPAAEALHECRKRL